MEPRFIIKTHTEALRPGNYSILITKCTYPDKGNYQEVVLKRLKEWIKEESTAKFTILLSTEKNRGFGFLLNNMIWSWKGHVINTVINYLGKNHNNDLASLTELTKLEKICYLRFFLETEGAIFLKLADRFTKTGELSSLYLRDNIQDIFKEIYQEYIDIAPDFRTRIRIKEMFGEMKSKRPYDKSTLAHKIKPHIQALADLGLLSVDKKDGEYSYNPINIGKTSTFAIIQNKLNNIQNMESMFSNDDYYPLIAEIYNLTPIPYSEDQSNLLKDTISFGYNAMRNPVTHMADINALIDWCCIKMLSEHSILVEKSHIESFLNKVRKISPSKIQYHVDGKGRVAYLVFQESL
jgi:hypothetical protein